MQPAEAATAAGKRHVERFGGQLGVELRLRQLFAARIKRCFELYKVELANVLFEGLIRNETRPPQPNPPRYGEGDHA